MEIDILVVDDCATTRKIVSYMVKSGGYNPVLAVNGLDALEKMAQHQIALIVTDLNMPQMDGFELVKNVKESPETSSIPVIMITTEGDELKKDAGLDVGVDIFMTKPVTSKWLTYQIKKLLP
ncbi:MAG: response regulator [Thermodesulfobacteriota bacterium]